MTSNPTKVTFTLMLAFVALVSAPCDFGSSAALPDDPVLRAMKIELERSYTHLKLEQMEAPYYIDYQIVDMDHHAVEATDGAMGSDVDLRLRSLRVVVRVGSYKQDSYYEQGQGTVDIVPLDDDELALRHHLWLATDKAYKAAIQSLAKKQAQLKQLTIDQPVDDFARADPVQHVEPLAIASGDTASWERTIQDASALYRTDPEVQSMSSSLESTVVNRYFVDSEGSVVRTGQKIYRLHVEARTQAADGMQLNQAFGCDGTELKDLPAPEDFLARAGDIIGTLRKLRTAPIADEDYRGPVLFSSHAASTVFQDLVGENILGRRPKLGQSLRTLGPFSSSYRSHVLPDFLSVLDDPTETSYAGKPLLGHYEVDNEGVKAMRVLAIDKGNLVNYLLGRQPIRDFPSSNGHGRGSLPAGAPAPSTGNLFVNASETLPQDKLKKKLIDLCEQHEQPYGYFVTSMSNLRNPALLYRVWAKDGREELVRGAVIADLDVRSLRNDLIAAGDDMTAWNWTRTVPPHSVVNPSILIDELEVKRTEQNKSKLPEYPPPPVTSSR